MYLMLKLSKDSCKDAIKGNLSLKILNISRTYSFLFFIALYR